MSKFFLYPILHFTRIASASLLTVFRNWGRSIQASHRYGVRATPSNRHRRGVKPPKLIALGLAIGFLLAVGLGWPSLNPVDAASASTLRLPLSTQGAKLVDASGRAVFLRGVNWFGIETGLHAPDGLSSRDYKEMLAQIKSLGYNLIRLPYSVESLRSKEVQGINYQLGSNRELEGKTPLEVMDAVIEEANRQGILILLDSHRLNDERIPELWYGDGFTEADWIDTWKMLATRYKKYANIIGADLKNEPHGRASWGTGDKATDWRLAAERAGNAILAINPNWLIVVEGVEKNVPGQKLAAHWMGGNLEGAERFPVRLSKPNKLVYSPHEYGAGVYNQPWFHEPSFPNNLENRWEIGWNYLATKNIAPILVGEFGGRQVDNRSKEGIWQRKFVDYIRRKDLSFAYWSWNPNSADTGGILQDDWQSVHQDKQALLQGLLVANAFAPSTASTPVITQTPKPKPSSSPVAVNPIPNPQPIQPSPTANSAQLQVSSNIKANWQDGFCTNIMVTNTGSTPIRDWQISFQMNQAAINNSWNGNFRPQGSQYTVTPLDWGRVIEPGQSRDLGFCANKLGVDYQPRQFSVSQR